MDVVFGKLYHWIKAHRQVYYKFFNFFSEIALPFREKKTHIEKYYPFPGYKIKPTNDSEYTEFHFGCDIICLPLQNRCRLQCMVNS